MNSFIIYKIDTGEPVFSIFNAYNDSRETFQEYLRLNNLSEEEYGVLDIPDEETNKLKYYHFTVKNGEIVYGEVIEQENSQQPLTEVKLLQQENAMLQMSIMELSTYAASQDERLEAQESAIMELSMLIMGGA